MLENYMSRLNNEKLQGKTKLQVCSNGLLAWLVRQGWRIMARGLSCKNYAMHEDFDIR